MESVGIKSWIPIKEFNTIGIFEVLLRINKFYKILGDKIKIIGSLEQVDDKYIKKYKSVPNLDFSSDHFMQATEIQI